MKPFPASTVSLPSRRARALPVLLVLLVACATTEHEPIDQVEDLIHHGRYAEAVQLAAREREERPGDARAEDLHRKASIAYLLEEGRQATFADRDVEALKLFAQALEIDPSSKAVVDWIQKTRLKLAERWLETALELHANDELEPAVDAYEKALEFSPGDPSAINGMASAVIQVNYRNGLGKRYFEEGLHALADYWLENARSRFSYAHKYKPGEERTVQRRVQVDALLARQRVAIAKTFEEARRYAAARNEHRLALVLDPSNTDAQAGLERTTKEARAAQALDDAEMEIVRGRFEQANAQLDEAEKLSTVQQDLIEGARAKVAEARFEKLYGEALALERDLDYVAAIEAYAALLTETPYFKDVLARKQTLEQYVALAADLYARAGSVATEAEELELLRQIEVFWPEYEDVEQRIAALEKGVESTP